MTDALPAWLHRQRYQLGEVFSFALEKFKQHAEFLILRTLGLAIVAALICSPLLYYKNELKFSLVENNLALAALVQWLFSSVTQAVVWFALLPLFLATLLTQSGKPHSVKRSLGMFARLIGCCVAQILPLVPLMAPVLILLGMFLFGGTRSLNADAWLSMPYNDFVQQFLVGYAVIIGLLLLGIYISLGLAFAALEVVLNPEASVLSALQTSWDISRSNRYNIYITVAMIALLNLCGALCVLGLLVTVPLSGMLWSTLFITLRNGANVSRALAPR